MKNIKYIIILLLAGLVLSCNDEWNKHYAKVEIEGDFYDGSLLELVKSNESYSKFYDALVKTGLDQELNRNQVMTLWIPTNDVIGSLPEDIDELKRLLNYHINMTSIYEDLFDGIIDDKDVMGRVRTFNGKSITLSGEDSGYSVNGHDIVKTNIITDNGVAHEIGELMTTRLNGYEYILSLGEEYSYIKEYIEASNFTEFDKNNSKPIGFDEVGQVIYDTVWVTRNSFLEEYGNISNEDKLYTLFLSRNEQIDAAVEDLVAYIHNIGLEADQDKAREWCLKNFFSGEYHTSYPADSVINLATGADWYTPKQMVDEMPVALSNGVVYEVQTLHVPRYTALEGFSVDFYNDWFNVVGSNLDYNKAAVDKSNLLVEKNGAGKATDIYWPKDGKDDPFIHFHCSVGIIGADPRALVNAKSGKSLRFRSGSNSTVGQDMVVDWKTISLSGNQQIKEFKLVPGQYDVFINQRTKYNTPTVGISLLTSDLQEELIINPAYQVATGNLDADSDDDDVVELFAGSIDLSRPEYSNFANNVNVIRLKALGVPYNWMFKSVVFKPVKSISNY